MQDGRCSKRYPKQYITETQLGADSYPLYRRRNPDDGGQVSNISMRIGGTRVDQEIDNRWIVPYNKLLLRSMNCHCNVELCMSIKSIKYVLKYVHNGCDQAMFALRSSQVDEISDYQIQTEICQQQRSSLEDIGISDTRERSSSSATCCPSGASILY